MFALMVASGLFISILLQPSISEIKQSSFSLPPQNVFFIVIFILLLLLIKALVHSLILDKYRLETISRQEVIAAYANSQVVRYLPGKVIGIIAQSLKLSDVAKASYIWETHLTQYVITNVVTIFIIFSAAAYFLLESKLIMILILTTSIISVPILTYGIITKVFNFMTRVFSMNSINTDIYNQSSSQSAFIVLLLYVEWIFYFLAWYYLVNDSFLMALYIGLLYAAASLFALLVFVVPNGILVREAIFLWLGSYLALSVDMFLFYGVIIRVLYILCEILFYLLAESLVKFRS